MLDIRNLLAAIGDTPILKGLSISPVAGEMNATMKPNGAAR